MLVADEGAGRRIPGQGSRRSPSSRRPVTTPAPSTAAALLWIFFFYTALLWIFFYGLALLLEMNTRY
jgi:hypothetical protein